MDLIAGKYVLDEQIGRGAMGLVYRGRDIGTGETVAIKTLDPRLVNDLPELIERFKREGEALQQLNHPNIVKLLATAEQAGKHYLVMAFVRGGDLAELLHKHGRLAQNQALTIALDLADALTRAHRLEILHRDLKPANVLIDENGLPRLSDFGIARLGKQAEITAAGSILGTVAYLSPEACMGEPLDERADIWAFGVMLYEMLSGQRPFSADTAVGTISHILHEPLPDIRELLPDIPDALEDLLYRMLAKNRGDRIPSVRLVGAKIEALLREQSFPSTSTPVIETDKTAIFRDTVVTPTPERLFRSKHNLPAQTTPFVGREIELAELDRLIAADHQRLVTILGPGGMGKTRLSLEVAERIANGTSSSQITFPDGVFFVELAAVQIVEQMFPAIATALKFAIEQGIEPQQQIIDYFSNKRALLLLDNCEHLLAAGVANAVSAFLQGAPDLQILVTSRQKLNLNGETIFNIEGLAFSDWESTTEALSFSAVQLFVQSAKRTMIDFELDKASLPHVAAICRLTEGMPLAILLAAAWVDMLSLPEIVSEIQSDIDFLESEMENLPPRQRSMRAVFDYSWAMLNEKEQAVFARLSVFQEGFTREAAQAVAGTSLRQLLGLVNKSLVQRDSRTGRFALHEFLRQLAAERLQSAGNANEIHTKHAGYFLNWIGGLYDALGNDDAAHTLQRIRPDHQNVLSGWLWAAEHHQRDDLLSAMDTWHYYMQGSDRNQETIDIYKQTLEMLPENDPSFTDLESKNSLLRARLLIRLVAKSVLVDHQGKPTDLEALYHYSQQRGERLEEGLLSLPLGLYAINQNNFPKAKTLLFNAIHILEEVQDNLRLMIYLHDVGSIMLLANQTELAVRMIERQIALAQKSNNKIFEAMAANWLTSEALLGQNNYELALERAETGVRLGMELWSQGFTADAVMVGLSYAGYCTVLSGDLPRAETFLQKAQEIAHTRNTQRYHYIANIMRWFIQVTRGEYDDIPIEHVGVDWSGAESVSRKVFGFTAAALGNRPIALSILLWVWTKPLIWSWTLLIVLYMPIALAILVDDGRYRYAAELLAMSREHPGCPHSWWEQLALLKDIEACIEANLSPEALATAQAHGRELDLKTTTAALIEVLKTMAPELE